MKMEGTIHCEGPDCEHSAHLGVETMNAGRMVPGFLKVIEFGHSKDDTHAFCTADCLLKWCALREPTEIIEGGPPPGFFGEPKEGDES